MTALTISVAALGTITIALGWTLAAHWWRDRQTTKTAALRDQNTALEAALRQADGMLQQRGLWIVALATKVCGTTGKTRISAAILKQAATQAVNVTPRKDGSYDLTITKADDPQ